MNSEYQTPPSRPSQKPADLNLHFFLKMKYLVHQEKG